MASSSKRVIYAALIGNLLLVICGCDSNLNKLIKDLNNIYRCIEAGRFAA